MNPYQQGQGYPQQQYLHNIGFANSAPQSFGNPMPMPGLPNMGYPQAQPGYPSAYPQANAGYPAQPSSGYPTQAYQTNQGYPTSAQSYPSQSYQAAQSYPQASAGYQQPSQGYPQASQGYPQPSQGYQQQNQYQGYPPSQTHAQSQAYSVSSDPVPSTPKSRPTVVPASPFDPRDDAAILRKAMKGFGTDEKAIIQVLTRRSNEQRLRIAFEFKTLYGKDLVSDLKSETSGRFEDLLVALMTPLPQFYAKELHDATAGIGTDEDVLIEVMCTMSNHEIQVIKQAYTAMPASPFDPRDDAAILRKAMKGFGTDEKAIIQVLTRRSNEQRLRIAFEFKTLYGKDLVSDLKSETSGRFEDLLVALMTPLPQFYAKELHDATAGIGTDEDVLIEVMCTMSNHEIQVIKQAYTAMYGTFLEDDLRGDTSGNFKRLMTSLCVGNRAEDFHVDQEKAREDARSLLQAGELRLGTDESVFNAILCSRSFPQLAAIFQEYHYLTGHDIDDSIKAEFSGDIEKALRAIVKVVRNKPLFFAERLHKSMKGLGTNDRQLIRVMVTRCELDLADIADMFQSKYGETLQSWIEGDCSGHYKKCLLSLLGVSSS